MNPRRPPPPRPPRPPHAPAALQGTAPPTQHGGPARAHSRPAKPPLRLQTTTLWDYPSQHYGEGTQGDARYIGATPSYIVWNLLRRYLPPDGLVVDPMCGSGTTLDVARDLERRALGFDVHPYRPDITQADARALPLEDAVADLVFLDPPYGDHIDYGDDPRSLGKLSAYDPRFYREMDKVFTEVHRILKPGGVFGLYVCDYFEKSKGFAPVGLQLFHLLGRWADPIDIVAVTRHNKSLQQGNWHLAAARDNFFLRGFNYLFLVRKPAEAQPAPRGGRGPRR